MDGWIALHRKLLDSPVAKNPKYGWTWVCLLLMANHKDNKTLIGNQMVDIKRGQLLTGRHALAKKTGVKEGTLEIILNLLESMKQIQQQKTNKYRLITVVNYNEYQTNQQQIDNRLTADLQQIDTNNNVNNATRSNNTMQTSPQGDAQIEKLLKEKTGTAYEYQDAGLSVWQELKAPEGKKGEFIRVFKNERSIAESAFRFSVDHPSANLRWKMFFWKYNQLLKLKPKV